MWKKVGAVLAICLLLLALCGCVQTPERAGFRAGETDRALLEAAGVFSDELEEMDRDIFVPWLGVSDAGLEAGAVYGSTGASAEELAVLEFDGEEAAKAAEEALLDHIEDMKRQNESYRPAEMPKLDKALVERRGSTVLLLVCDDYAKAAEALAGAG